MYFSRSLENYFSTDSQEERKDILNTFPFDANIIGEYLYEAKMYDTIYNTLQTIGKQDNVVKIEDYGFLSGSQLNGDIIFLDNSKIKLTENYTGKSRFDGCRADPQPVEMSNILDILDSIYGSPGPTIYCYLMTKCYPEYDTLKNVSKDTDNRKMETYMINTINILQYLKSTIGFSHNDLHYENLLVNSEGNIKLFDFDQSSCLNPSSIPLDYGKKYIVTVLVEMYKSKEFTDFSRNFRCISTNPPQNEKELSYTIDLFRLIVEPFIEKYIGAILQKMHGKHIADTDIMPKVTIDTTILKDKLDILINPELFSILRKHNCIDDKLSRIILKLSAEQDKPFRMMYIFSWLLFGNVRELFFDLNKVSIEIQPNIVLGGKYKKSKKNKKLLKKNKTVKSKKLKSKIKMLK